MSEAGDAMAATPESDAPGPAAPATGGTGVTASDPASPEEPASTNWVFYGLGLSLQTLLWFLLFLALVIAIAVGGELTEFRYVGF